MRKQHTSQPVTLRFRRWSRKAYAAFISIRQAVTIGQLTANVSERFRAKQESIHGLTLWANQSLYEEETTAESDLLNESLQTSALLWSLLTAIPLQMAKQPDTAAYTLYIYYFRESGSLQYDTEGFRSFCFHTSQINNS